jgi:anaerobic ribonucleoside-triphosphate reductase
MVVNNLIIKLKNRDQESINTAVNVLQGLKGNIPVLIDSQVEVDVNAGKSAYDIMLINKFASADDLPVYLKHPVHVKVAEYITGVIEASASLCFEAEK